MRGRWMLVALVTLAVAVAVPVVLWLATSRAGCAGNAAGPVSSTANASPSTEEYWTPERMRSARGAPMPAGRPGEGC